MKTYPNKAMAGLTTHDKWWNTQPWCECVKAADVDTWTCWAWCKRCFGFGVPPVPMEDLR